jgi:sugar phosphate isomerase/epimerase
MSFEVNSRRSFLRQTGSLLALGTLPSLNPTPVQANSLSGKAVGGVAGIKTSCVSWCFHGFDAGIDPEPAIDEVGSLGFDGIELMINQQQDLSDVWTKSKIDSVRNKLQSHKLELVALVPFFPVIVDLGSSQPAALKKSLDNFEKVCRIGQQLGTKRIEIIGPHVEEFTVKSARMGIPSFMYKLDNYQPGDKIHLDMPEIIDWESIWKRMVGVIRKCVQLTKKYGLELLIEPHYHSIIPDTATFLLMWNEIKEPTLKLTTDTGWGTQQCEYPPMNVHRAQKHLKVVQFRDVDAQTRKFVPFGEGVVDVEAVLKALKQTNFDGYVSFEEVFMKTAREDAVNFVKAMQELIAKK